MADLEMKCEHCNNEEYISLVSYGSYYFQCPNCKNLGPATSFISIQDSLVGDFEVIEVDKNLKPLTFIGKGLISNQIELISAAARNGKIIWLKKIG